MDWGALGKKLEQYGAPLLGAVIPPPAGLAVSAILAAKFGGKPDDPDSLAAAIDADPQAAVKLKQMELDHDTALQQIAMQKAVGLAQADASQVQSVNTTMQAEAQSEHWLQWCWRPICGLALALGFLVLIALVGWICILSVTTNQPGLLAAIPQILQAFTILFGAMASVVGITAWHRGVTQRIQAGQSSATDDLVAAVASKLGVSSPAGNATVIP